MRARCAIAARCISAQDNLAHASATALVQLYCIHCCNRIQSCMAPRTCRRVSPVCLAAMAWLRFQLPALDSRLEHHPRHEAGSRIRHLPLTRRTLLPLPCIVHRAACLRSQSGCMTRHAPARMNLLGCTLVRSGPAKTNVGPRTVVV